MIYGYIRVSSDKQTVENQRFEINEFIKKNDLRVDRWVHEVISGVKNFEERKLGKLLKGLKKGDVLFGISTSGNSPNVIKAFESGKEIGCYCMGLSGRNGGTMNSVCDLNLIIPSDHTPRIQEAHILVIHILCGLIEADY